MHRVRGLTILLAPVFLVMTVVANPAAARGISQEGHSLQTVKWSQSRNAPLVTKSNDAAYLLDNCTASQELKGAKRTPETCGKSPHKWETSLSDTTIKITKLASLTLMIAELDLKSFFPTMKSRVLVSYNRDFLLMVGPDRALGVEHYDVQLLDLDTLFSNSGYNPITKLTAKLEPKPLKGTVPTLLSIDNSFYLHYAGKNPMTGARELYVTKINPHTMKMETRPLKKTSSEEPANESAK